MDCLFSYFSRGHTVFPRIWWESAKSTKINLLKVIQNLLLVTEYSKIFVSDSFNYIMKAVYHPKLDFPVFNTCWALWRLDCVRILSESASDTFSCCYVLKSEHKKILFAIPFFVKNLPIFLGNLSFSTKKNVSNVRGTWD